MNPGTDWAEQGRALVETLRGVLGSLVDTDDRPPGAGAPPRSAECRWCPLCQLIAALRGERPEVTAALADILRATADALHAFAAAPDAPRPPEPGHDPAGDAAPVGDPPPVVQRIEIA